MTGLDADDPPFPSESFQKLPKISPGLLKTFNFFQILSKNFTRKLRLVRHLRPNLTAETAENLRNAARRVPELVINIHEPAFLRYARLTGKPSPRKVGAGLRGPDKNILRCGFRTYHEHTLELLSRDLSALTNSSSIHRAVNRAKTLALVPR
jgi:hypothetical protein